MTQKNHLFGSHTTVWALAAALALNSSMACWAGGPPSVGPQIRIDVAGGNANANEHSSAADQNLPGAVVATWNDYRQNPNIRMGVGVTIDGGATWSDFLVRPPVPNQAATEGDPMTAFDPRTGTLWVGAISFAGNGGVFVARKNAGSATFAPSVMSHTTGGADKGWMAAGPRPGLPDTTRLYIAYNLGVNWSDDLGSTWTLPVSLGSGLGFLPRIGPNGELYLAYWNGGSGVMLKRSLDGGLTYVTRTIATRMDVWGSQDGSRFPGAFRVPPLNYLAVDPNTGVLYAVYFDTTAVLPNGSNVDLYFTKSTNMGDTWTPPVVINGDNSPPGDQFFPWMEVDEFGRIHIVFLDSRHVVQNDSSNIGWFDAYYIYSLDGGASWTEVRLTPNSWTSGTSSFIGDYMGLAVSNNTVYPTYIDTHAGSPDVYTNIITFPNPADINNDFSVDVLDLLAVINGWGTCMTVCPPACPPDINGDCAVNVSDLLLVINNWS